MNKDAMLRAQINAKQAADLRSPAVASGMLGYFQPEAHVSMNWMDGRVQHQVNLQMPNDLVGHVLVRINELLEERDAEARAQQEAIFNTELEAVNGRLA